MVDKNSIEWTTLVVARFDSLDSKFDKLSELITDLRVNAITDKHIASLKEENDKQIAAIKEEMDAMEKSYKEELRITQKDVQDLKDYKTKAVTIFATLNVMVVAAWAIITHFTK